MGQARLRGTFEQRKEEAILREKQRREAQRQWDIEHPRKPSKGKLLPLYAAMAMANEFEYRPLNEGVKYATL